MKDIIRVLGKKGRITIPYAMRVEGVFKPDDILRFQMPDCNTIIIHRELLCDLCEGKDLYNEPSDEIEELFDELTAKEKHEVLTHLIEKWGKEFGGKIYEGTRTVIPFQPKRSSTKW